MRLLRLFDHNRHLSPPHLIPSLSIAMYCHHNPKTKSASSLSDPTWPNGGTQRRQRQQRSRVSSPEQCLRAGIRERALLRETSQSDVVRLQIQARMVSMTTFSRQLAVVPPLKLIIIICLRALAIRLIGAPPPLRGPPLLSRKLPSTSRDSPPPPRNEDDDFLGDQDLPPPGFQGLVKALLERGDWKIE